jgi:hypothetical protein
MALAEQIPADVDTDPIHRQTETTAIVIEGAFDIGAQSFSSEKA